MPIELGVAVVVHEHTGLGLGGVGVKGAAKAHLDHGVLLGFVGHPHEQAALVATALDNLEEVGKANLTQAAEQLVEGTGGNGREPGILGVATLGISPVRARK